MSEQSDSEHRVTKYSNAMGEDLGRLYAELENEYFWLRLKWQEYLALFASPARVDILNAAAPSYFLMLEDTLSDDIILHIARLTDPAKSFNKKTNLTIRALCEPAFPSDSALGELVDKAVLAASFATDWRNRRIAHRDLQLALRRPVDALPPATRKTIDAALDALHAVFSYVCSKYFRAQLDPEVLEAPGGADALLYVLRDGVKYRQEILYRFESGDNRVEFEPLPA